MNSTAVVVLNWNGMADTLQALASLRQQTLDNFTIVLIDNGSTEVNTKEKLAEARKEYGTLLHIIENPKNDGFAGGVNIGINYALENDYSYVALFNNDAVADKAWLKELVTAINKNDCSIATGLLLSSDSKTIDSTGDWYSIWGLPFPRSRGDDVAKAPSSGFVFGASGGASLYKTSLFKDIGLFDESFFAYYEDVDISFRAQLSGKKVYYTDKAIAYHKQGATSNKIPGFAVYQTFKNLPMLLLKNVPLGLFAPVLPRFFVAYYLMLGKAILSRQAPYALKGWGMSVILLPTTLVKRWRIQMQKIVSGTTIRQMLWDDLPPEQSGLRKLFKK